MTGGLAAADLDHDVDLDLVEANNGGVNRRYLQAGYLPRHGEITSNNILDGLAENSLPNM